MDLMTISSKHSALQWDSRYFKIFSQISTLIKTYIVGFRVSLVCHYSNEQDYITIRNYTGVVGSKKRKKDHSTLYYQTQALQS